MGTKEIPVVSFVTYDGTTLDRGISSGGFYWYLSDADAVKAFDREVECYRDGDQLSRVRYVVVTVPEELDGSELTEYIDAELLDEIEVTGTPIKESFVIDGKELKKAYIWRYDSDPQTFRPWILSRDGHDALDFDTWEDAIAAAYATLEVSLKEEAR